MLGGPFLSSYDFDQDELLFPISGLTQEEQSALDKLTLETLAKKTSEWMLIPPSLGELSGVRIGHKP